MTSRHRAIETDVKPERRKRGMTPSQGLAMLLAKVSPVNVSESVRDRAQELCESRGGRPGLPVPNGPYGLKEANEE